MSSMKCDARLKIMTNDFNVNEYALPQKLYTKRETTL